jgi:ankyrin repeat protein
VKRRLITIAIIVCAAACLVVGGWWAWRTFWSADQLRAAVKADDTEKVRRLIKLGASVNTDVAFESVERSTRDLDYEKYGKLLHWAALKGHKDTVELLLAHGADVDEKDSESLTAMDRAVDSGHYDTAELLLDHGADVDAKDFHGWTALHWAASRGRKSTERFLLAHGADVNAKADGGDTALLCALLHGPVYPPFPATDDLADTVGILLAHGADVNAKGWLGWTVLHWAARNHRNDTAELFLAHGADPSIKDNDYKTPIDYWPFLAEIVKKVEAEKAAKERKP